MKAIKNAQIVLENGIIWDGIILIDGHKISDFGSSRNIDIPTGAEVIDAGGAYVGPGFVDIHCHGGNGFSTSLEGDKAAEFFLSHGSTTILSTPSGWMNYDLLLDAIRAARESISRTKTIKGIYFEGPFINPKYGANSDINPWRDAISPERAKAIVDAAGTDAKVWAIAPEREDISNLLAYARKVNPNAVFAIAHSEATPEQIRALGKYRPSISTHAFNATGRQNERGGIRGYGPDEYCLQEQDVYAELISDSLAIHVHPDMQRLLIHNKGLRRMILITDSTPYNRIPPEEFAHTTDLNFDHNGGLAGSKLTMDQACKNIMTHTNCGIAHAFLMASTNPARALGMEYEIGSIDKGKNADLVFVDDKFSVKRVMLEGEIKY